MKKVWSEIKSHKEICVYGQTQTKLEEMTLSELLALELGLPEQSNQDFEQLVGHHLDVENEDIESILGPEEVLRIVRENIFEI